MTDAQVRAAAAAANAAGEQEPGSGHATELVSASEYGVSFTSDYEPGGSYPAKPPPPAEEQHAMGLHQNDGEG